MFYLQFKQKKESIFALMKKIAVFASGAGSNAQKIIETANAIPNSLKEGKTDLPTYQVSLIVCNKPEAGVLKIADKENIPSLLIEKERFFRGDAYVPALKAADIDFIVLAGFLWKVPTALIAAFANKIINIHPALLPKYGGKGMYGQHVHQAVVDNQEAESGITIHYVDEKYDHGQIIFQATCPVNKDDTADTLAQRIHQLEHFHYPTVIASLMA
jgi:phosphoribosylglycinamide formyltransferase 1